MNSLLEGVNRRTQIAGNNRLELLLFFLDGDQHYGINVFKVHEVIQRPPMTRVPNANPHVVGMATLRGKTIPIIDLAMAIGREPISGSGQGIVIVTEYNRSVQGFLVRAVDRIVNMNWENVVPPPGGVGNNHFLTAIAHVENHMVEMIDVERVLSNVSGETFTISEKFVKDTTQSNKHVVLVVDDSSMARSQIKRTLESIGVVPVLANNGKAAYELLTQWVETNDPQLTDLLMVISDVEMPEMDGYTLTTKIRGDHRLQGLYVMLHTSLSGIFNHSLINKVDANAFVPKFDANDLAQAVVDKIKDKETSMQAVR